MTELTDLSDTDASNTAVTGNSTQGNVANMGGMENLQQAILGMLSRFRNANIFRLRDNTDNTKLLAFDLSGLSSGTRTLTVPDESARLALAQHLAGHLYGLTLSNNATDATNDIDIAAGNAIDSTNTHVMTLASALTKRLDAAWAVGTGNGGRMSAAAIADTTYHIFLIKRVDTGVVDVGFDTSPTAPTLPANYTLFRRIGSIIRITGAIRLFTQVGDDFFIEPVISDNTTNPGTAARSVTLFTPAGIVTEAIVSGMTLQPAAAGTCAVLYSSLAAPDNTPLLTGAFSYVVFSATGTQVGGGGEFRVGTDTNSAIRTRVGVSGGSTVHYISSRGWVDRRGRT